MRYNAPRPTNAYEMCMQAADLIEASPIAYNQETWLDRVDEFFDVDELEAFRMELRDKGDHRKILGPMDQAADERNECGTVGCRAGWMATRVYSGKIAGFAVFNLVLGILRDHASSHSCESLFLDDLDDLFSGNALKRANQPLELGTSEYAAEGASGIREFATKWKDRLLATPIPSEDEIRATYA